MFDSINSTLPAEIRSWRLAWACGLSLFLHALILASPQITRAPRHDQAPPPLAATLAAPMPLPPQPTLLAPPDEPPPQPTLLAPPDEPPPQAVAHRRRQAPIHDRGPAASLRKTEMASLASRQLAQHLFYPTAAIARGLEGEALVMLFLDESGRAIAARLERSSGYGILDEAALAAARAIGALPVGSPQEVLLPVRFRLR